MNGAKQIYPNDNCEEGEVYQWKFSQYKDRHKKEVVHGVTKAILTNQKMINPVVLNSLSFDDAKKIYYKK